MSKVKVLSVSEWVSESVSDEVTYWAVLESLKYYSITYTNLSCFEGRLPDKNYVRQIFSDLLYWCPEVLELNPQLVNPAAKFKNSESKNNMIVGGIAEMLAA